MNAGIGEGDGGCLGRGGGSVISMSTVGGAWGDAGSLEEGGRGEEGGGDLGVSSAMIHSM